MLNQVQIIGRLGQDPEIRYMPSGEAVANISVATTEKWKDKQSGEAKEATEWHKVSVFGKLAEICGEYLHKGDLVFFQGKLQTRKWTDQQGQERYTTEIRASEMKMLGSKQQGGAGAPAGSQGGQARPAGQPSAPRNQGQAAPQGQAGGYTEPPMDFSDDIPF